MPSLPILCSVFVYCNILCIRRNPDYIMSKDFHVRLFIEILMPTCTE